VIKPVNRYVHISFAPTAQKLSEESRILLPADFKEKEERYSVASVKSFAEDVRFAAALSEGSQILVDRSMVEEIMVKNQLISVVQDNYIIGILESE